MASDGVPNLTEPMSTGSHFVCQECGHSALAWTGRCPGCGEWNTLVEAKRSAKPRRGGSARAT